MAAETLGLAERRELLALTQVADSLRRGLSAARFLHTFVRDTVRWVHASLYSVTIQT